MNTKCLFDEDAILYTIHLYMNDIPSVPTSIPKNFWLALIGLKNISDAFNNAAVEKVLAATKGLPFPVNRRERAHHDKMAVFTDKNPVSASI